MDWKKWEKDPKRLKRISNKLDRNAEAEYRQKNEPDKFLRQVNEPAINELLDLLSLGSGLPKVSFSQPPWPASSRALGWYKPFMHEVGFRPHVASDIHQFSPSEHYIQQSLNTVKHELTHALDRNMMFHSVKNPTSTFTSSYNKLNPANSNIPGYKQKRDSSDDYTSYRYSGDEARAFGVADTVYPRGRLGDVKDVPRHLDATLATEFEVLKDLYKRSFQRK